MEGERRGDNAVLTPRRRLVTTTARGQKSKCSKDKQGGGKTRNAKAAMTIDELFEYF